MDNKPLLCQPRTAHHHHATWLYGLSSRKINEHVKPFPRYGSSHVRFMYTVLYTENSILWAVGHPRLVIMRVVLQNMHTVCILQLSKYVLIYTPRIKTNDHLVFLYRSWRDAIEWWSTTRKVHRYIRMHIQICVDVITAILSVCSSDADAWQS